MNGCTGSGRSTNTAIGQHPGFVTEDTLLVLGYLLSFVVSFLEPSPGMLRRCVGMSLEEVLVIEPCLVCGDYNTCYRSILTSGSLEIQLVSYHMT